MRKWLVLSILAVAGMFASTNRASAYGLIVRPYYTSAAFPCLNPPGYFTNSYYFPWHYPWFAYYNYSHGPYANWWWWGGYATYGGNCGPYGCGHGYAAAAPAATPVATIAVTLPANARLLFNGVEATGSGEVRTYLTPPLAQGQEYAYDLAAEVVVEGKVLRATDRIKLKAGQEVAVKLMPAAPAK